MRSASTASCFSPALIPDDSVAMARSGLRYRCAAVVLTSGRCRRHRAVRLRSVSRLSALPTSSDTAGERALDLGRILPQCAGNRGRRRTQSAPRRSYPGARAADARRGRDQRALRFIGFLLQRAGDAGRGRANERALGLVGVLLQRGADVQRGAVELLLDAANPASTPAETRADSVVSVRSMSSES